MSKQFLDAYIVAELINQDSQLGGKITLQTTTVDIDGIQLALQSGGRSVMSYREAKRLAHMLLTFLKARGIE